MQFVDDEQIYVLHVLALFPSARQHVPLLRRADHDVTLAAESRTDSDEKTSRHRIQPSYMHGRSSPAKFIIISNKEDG